MANHISEGDIVKIYWCDGSTLEAEVLHVPCDTGDMWYFKTKDGATYCQNPQSSNFDCIIKEKTNP